MEFSFANFHRSVKDDLITFRPLDIERDAEVLYQISNGEPYKNHPGFDPNAIWEFLYYKPLLPGFKAFREYLELVTQVENQVVFTLELTKTGEVFGMHAFQLFIESKTVIGGLFWISPIYRDMNLSATYGFLALNHVFSTGAKWYVWKVMTSNVKLIRSNTRNSIPILKTEMIMFPWHLKYIPGIVYHISEAQFNGSPML